MLIECPECNLKASDLAVTCPHCGYPLKPEKISKAKNNRRRRLPNGFGQISKMKGRFLRKPYRALVTVGRNPDGSLKTRLLKPQGYFETYNDAYNALTEYNKHPYDLSPSMTMQELFTEWFQKRTEGLAEATRRGYKGQWAYCTSIHKMRVTDVRARHIKYCMEEGTATVQGKLLHTSPRIKSRIKALLNLMFDYAVEMEIVDKNVSRSFNMDKEIIVDMEEKRVQHISFTEDEMKALWENINLVPYVNYVIIQCYSGLRPQELCKIELMNVHLNENYIIGGMKTKAGINRRIPIHPAIKRLIEDCYRDAVEHNSKMLFNCFDAQPPVTYTELTYNQYSHRFHKVIERLRLDENHKPHDARKQFVTMAKAAGLDEYALKYIVGHQIYDLTESVYTDRDPTWLNREIEKIDASRFLM